MSSLPADDDGSVLPSARTPTTVVDGDVVFSCVALLFLALVLVFVLYHYFIVHRPAGVRAAAGTASSGPRLGAGAAAAASAPGAAGGKGVVPVVLRALSVTLYRAKDFPEEELECAVCLADLSDGEAARFLPKCGHGFHADCVDLWLRSHPTCPLCRVDVDKPDALPPALPPVRPERANYGNTNLPTNVLFRGSQDAVTTRGTAGGPRSSDGVTAIVIDVPETTSLAVVPRDGDATKSQGLARLRSIGRRWSSRGRCEVGASSSAGSCHRVTAGARTQD